MDFIRSKGIERLGLFGLSQGGCTVLMSLKEIDDISCAVLLNPLTDAVPEYWDEKLGEEDRERLEDQGFIEWKRGEGFREKYLVPKELIETKKNLDQDKLLEGINIPVKIIQGKEDQTITLEKSRKASEKLENGSLSVIDDDHYWNESIDEVSDIATKFFSRHLFN